MTKENFYFKSSDGETSIHGIKWVPDGEVTAVLQICHGMAEYIDRYDRFARFLTAHGILVVGNDHLGHGESVQSTEKLGFFKEQDGLECVIDDIHTVYDMTHEVYPDKPYFLLGHSMGSFFARQYISLYGEDLSGAIVMGTGTQNGTVLCTAMMLCRVIALFKGWDHRSKLVDTLAFSSNNSKFEPARTKQDWLTKDESIVDKYRSDPWCTYRFTLNGFYQMFRSIQYVQTTENIKKTPDELPILIVSGANDPVGNFGKGVKSVYDRYKKTGKKNVTIKLYENDRHEILNELDFENVFDDIKLWLEDIVIREKSNKRCSNY